MDDCTFVSLTSRLSSTLVSTIPSKPWILSNIIDSRTGGTPEGIQKFCVFERGNVKIGVIGLAEE
jgi:2',3'-cyclic-nucleotide 2'-phosphodiesterase (5'-nucleotidase family)